jgi:O-antigen/teichoic acid export membrane protein
MSVVLRIVAMVLNFLLLPMYLHRLGMTQYGIWIALQSIAAWASLVGLGISQGFRNKLTIALDNEEFELAKEYVSSAIMGVLALASIALILPWLATWGFSLNWEAFLKADQSDSHQLATSLFLVYCAFLLNQVFEVPNNILFAAHWNSLAAATGLISNSVLLATLYAGSFFGCFTSLLHVSMLFFAVTLLSNLAVTSTIFCYFSKLIPTVKGVSFTRIKEMTTLGIGFFVIQIAFIAVFATDRFVVLKYLGAEHVPAYDVAIRLFGLVPTVLTLFMTPLWSLFGVAFNRGDTVWLSSQLKKLQWSMVPILIAIMLLCANIGTLASLVLGVNVDVSSGLRISLLFYTLVVCWNMIFATFLNGIGRTKEQAVTAIAAGITVLPLSIYLAVNLGMGTAGVVIASTLVLSVFAIVGPMTTFAMIRARATA